MEIKIYDSNKTELNIGDIVQLQQERNGQLTFYTKIQVINGKLFPFNKFCFDRALKVDSIPPECKHIQADISRGFPEYWMHPKQELALIEDGRLQKWRLNVCSFERNEFFEVVQ